MKPRWETKIVLAAAVALAIAPAAARAQTAVPNLPIVPLSFCQLAALGSAVGLSSCSRGIPAGATMAAIRAEGAAIRYLDDGAAPTATVGQPILTTDPPLFYVGTLAALQFIEESSGASVDVLFYR